MMTQEDSKPRLAAELVYKLLQTKKVGGAHVPVDSIYQGPLAERWSRGTVQDVVDEMVRAGLLIDHEKEDGDISLAADRLDEVAEKAAKHLDEDRARILLRRAQPYTDHEDEEGEEVEDGPSYVTETKLEDAMSDVVTRNLLDEKIRSVNKRIADLQRTLQNVTIEDGEASMDVGHIENELQRLDQRVDTLRDALDGLEVSEERFDAVEEQVKNLDQRLADVEAWRADIAEDLKALFEEQALAEEGEPCTLCEAPATHKTPVLVPDGATWTTVHEDPLCSEHSFDAVLKVSNENRSALQGLARRAAETYDEVWISWDGDAKADEETAGMLARTLMDADTHVLNVNREDTEPRVNVETEEVDKAEVEQETGEEKDPRSAANLLDEPFECPFCDDFETEFNNGKYRHFQAKHPGVDPDSLEVTLPEREEKSSRLTENFECPFCEFETDWHPNINQHLGPKHGYVVEDGHLVTLAE